MTGTAQIDIIAASIAAELYHAANLAKEVSLIAKNARAISLQAGERSSGFKAITVFINEFAEKTINQANKINNQAVSISRHSIDQKRVQNTANRFELAWDLAGPDSHRDDLTSIILSLNESAQIIQEEMWRQLKKLRYELDESEMQIRAAGIIATTSKTEASRAGEYRESLDSIAVNIQVASGQISNHLKLAGKLLNNMEAMSV